MHLFQQFLSEKIYHTLPRQSSIPSSKTLIYGPPKCGKTSLALDFLSSLELPIKKMAYVDCQDPRIHLEEVKNELLKLFLEKKIEALILDSYLPSLPLPNLPYVLLISSAPQDLPSFKSLKLQNLSFAEYVSFDKKNFSPQTLLKNFIKDGNSPQIPFLNEFQKIKTKQENLRIALQEDFLLFCKLSAFQSQKITAHQFYSLLKKQIKISKDKIYAFWEKLLREGLIFTIPHLQEQKPKKLYFYDFSLSKSLTSQSTILQILENMFVLELQLLLQRQGDVLFYDDQNFFLTHKHGAFLFAPFAHRDFILQKIQKCPYPWVKIITLQSQEEHWEFKQFEQYGFLEFSLGGIE